VEAGLEVEDVKQQRFKLVRKVFDELHRDAIGASRTPIGAIAEKSVKNGPAEQGRKRGVDDRVGSAAIASCT
jgi:hypothetical protein